MATEIVSLWGAQIGWRSGPGERGYEVCASLDGIRIWYRGPSAELVKQAFSRVCRRTVSRRFLRWIAPPPSEIVWQCGSV